MRLLLTAVLAVCFTGLCQAKDFPDDAQIALAIAKTKHRMLYTRTTFAVTASCTCPKGQCPAGGNCVDCKCSPKAVATTGDKQCANGQCAGTATAKSAGIVTSGSCSSGSCSSGGTAVSRGRDVFSVFPRGRSRCSGGSCR